MPEPTERLSATAKWALMALFALALVVLLLLIAEGGIRVRQTLKYGAATTAEDLYTIDPASGLRVPRVGSHYSGRITVNSRGFRGPEIAVPKPPDTVRVAFLGASTTWCAEVSSDAQVWPHLVTHQLQAAFPGARIDYVNGGVPGYTVSSSQANLERRVEPLAPDIVVIYHATNDLSGELRQLAAARGLIDSAQFSERSWLSEHSLLWDLAQKNLRILAAEQAAQANVKRLEVDAASLGDEFLKGLTTLVDAAKANGKLVAIATFSTQLRIEQDEAQQLRASASALYYMPFMTPAGLLRAYARYNDIIRSVAADTGAILIDGENEIPADAAHFADTVHFLDAGSARMATRVVRVLANDARVRQLMKARADVRQ